MKNEIEVIDGVKGEWRTVTKPEEVTVGQRVRYSKNDRNLVDNRFIKSTKGLCSAGCSIEGEGVSCSDLFDGYWSNIQAFFPLPVKPKRKVAKVEVYEYHGVVYWKADRLNGANIHTNSDYKSRKSAIRGARRFCRAIGYECEIVK